MAWINFLKLNIEIHYFLNGRRRGSGKRDSLFVLSEFR